MTTQRRAGTSNGSSAFWWGRLVACEAFGCCPCGTQQNLPRRKYGEGLFSKSSADSTEAICGCDFCHIPSRHFSVSTKMYMCVCMWGTADVLEKSSFQTCMLKHFMQWELIFSLNEIYICVHLKSADFNYFCFWSGNSKGSHLNKFLLLTELLLHLRDLNGSSVWIWR